MPYFPQLSTGAMSQYPVVRAHHTRTIVNHSLDENTVKLGDPEGKSIQWELRLSGLTDAEWDAIATLFHSCEGSLYTFTFLDPADNLLCWSEDLSENEWQKDPLIALVDEVPDPFGSNRATRISNTSQTTQGISQSLEVPADLRYCLSLYARSSQPRHVALKRFSASGSETDTVEVSYQWRRFASSGNLGVSESPISFGFKIEAGATIEVFGLQVEAQPGASDYKKTEAHGGVHADARFLEDSLTVTTEGPDQHSSVIRITSTFED